MAGNRPKSLDELNSIFDKTLAAEKAIKKGSSLLEKGEDIFANFSFDESKDIQSTEKQDKQSEEISGNVSEFIAKFTAQTEVEAEPEPVIAKPQMTVLTPEKLKKEAEANTAELSQETPYESEKVSRDELMDEYVRIMSDEEDDVPSKKKISRKEKKKRKKQKNGKNFAAEESVIEEAIENKETEEKVETVVQEETEQTTEETEQVFEDVTSETEVTAADSAEEDVSVKTSDFEIQEEEITFDEEQEVAEEKNDFEFPENYTPEWMKEEEAEKKEEKLKKERNKKEKIKKEKTADKKAVKNKKGYAALKVFLSIVFVALVCVGSFATVFKTFVAVNTGKVIADNYYVFTANKDYPELNLLEGDLIVTEKRYAGDGEIFAYVDYNSRTFEFGKRADSITKEDGEVLYVIEKDGGRTLVSRDDCKGVIFSRFENHGKIVGFLADNYIIVISVVAVACLIIILLFALVLKEKKVKKVKDEKNAVDTLEVSDEDFENIFSEI